MSDVDNLEDWKYEDFYREEPDEPNEPCWACWGSESAWCWDHLLPPLRVRRRVARRERHRIRLLRKVRRHDRDRFWQARNRPVFDDEAPF